MTELIEAYHAVFDWKDQQVPGSQGFVAAADACRAIARVIALTDLEVPQRFDGQGRAGDTDAETLTRQIQADMA